MSDDNQHELTSERVPTHPIHAQFTQRWSPRAFTGEALERTTLMRFLEAARWAPSGWNAQPWRFVYGLSGTPAWQTLLDTLAPFNQSWAHRASALVLVLSNRLYKAGPGVEAVDNPTHAFDAGAAWAQLALQAALEGWHTHGIGGFDRARARSSLCVPEHHEVLAMVAIGRRGDAAVLPESLRAREKPSQRLPLDALIGEGRFPD